MRVLISERFSRSFKEAPEKIQKNFGKQLAHLLKDLRFPSLRLRLKMTGNFKYDGKRNFL